MRVSRLAFGVRGLAFGVERDGGKAIRRYGDWAIVVPTAFEDDDEYEEDGVARGLA
jgi:hypothetical protein